MERASIYLGKTTWRREGRLVGMLQDDRFLHMLILGQTGTGKTTLIRSMALQDAAAGRGFMVLDPHGDLAEDLHQELIAMGRRHRYLDLGQMRPDFSYNPLADIELDNESFVVNSIVDVFRHLWTLDDAPRFEHLLRNVLFALLAHERPSLHLIPETLTDKAFRRRLLRRVKNEEVLRFWRDEYDGYSAKFRAVVVAPLQNKIGALLTDPRLRQMLADGEGRIDLRREMDSNGIVVVNLAKGRVGSGPASLVGSLLLTECARLAFTRADQAEWDRRDFIVYADEFHQFTTGTVASMLSELRKYRVGVVLAAQFMTQMRRDVRDSVGGNVGSKLVFRIGSDDAQRMAAEFGPRFALLDLMETPNWHAKVRIAIAGAPSKAFSMETLGES